MHDLMKDVPKLSGAVCGVKQVKRALKAKNVSKLYLASDADRNITVPLSDSAGRVSVPVVWVPSMHMLGRMCDIDVGCSAAALNR